MKIMILGSGGWIPTPDRHTSCYLLDCDEYAILLDAGTGISRLSQYGDLLDKYDELHIILSHYHFDHIIGLQYLQNWTKNKKILIYGPGKDLVNKSCEEILHESFSSPSYLSIDRIGKSVEYNDYNHDGFNIHNQKIKIHKQVHTGQSFGIEVVNFIYYATDTQLTESTFINALKCKLLLHDTWFINEVDSSDHTSFEGLLEMFLKYPELATGLIHINPNFTTDDFNFIQEKLNGMINKMLVSDGMCFDL